MSFIKITIDEIQAIKNRLNAEMTRRKYNGDLTSYAGDEYQFEAITPKVTKVNKSIYNKLVEPLNAVKSSFTTISDGELKHILRDDYLEIESKLTLYESNSSYTSSTNDCGAACSGLCITQCSTGCTGCTGTCSTTCSGSCTGSCSGSCTGGCSGCGSSCGSTCTGGCSGCSGLCQTGCENTCQIVSGCGMNSMHG